jgi:hypothetical protein
VPKWAIWSLTAAFAAIVVTAANVLLAIWPDDPPAKATAVVSILWGRLSVSVTPNDRLMLVAMLTGVIGSMVHAMTSFADFAGNARLSRAWIPWYLLRPFIGMGLALFFYVVVRAGLLSVQTQVGDINPYGIAAIAGLAGMFSKQATDKLNETFTTLFKTGDQVGDAQRSGKLLKHHPTKPTDATKTRNATKPANAGVVKDERPL